MPLEIEGLLPTEVVCTSCRLTHHIPTSTVTATGATCRECLEDRT